MLRFIATNLKTNMESVKMTKTKELKNCVDDLTGNIWKCEREHNASGFRNHEILRVTAENGFKVASVIGEENSTTAKKMFKYLCDFHDSHSEAKINLTALDMDSRTAEIINADVEKQKSKADTTAPEAKPFIDAFNKALELAQKKDKYPHAEDIRLKIESMPESVRAELYKAFLPSEQPKSDVLEVAF